MAPDSLRVVSAGGEFKNLRRRRRRRRVYVLYKNQLFSELLSTLLRSSEDVQLVGLSNSLTGAADAITKSKAETVVLEGNAEDPADISLLNYFAVSALPAPWLEVVMVSAQASQFATLYRGKIEHLDAERLISLVLAG